MKQEFLNSETDLNTSEGIQFFLSQQSISVNNLELLPGGYTSQVYRGYQDQDSLIIKHSLPRESFYPIYQVMEESRARTEVEILERLNPFFPNQVPQIIEFFEKEDIIIMSDVGQNSQLGLDYLLSGKASPQHALALGIFLAQLKQVTSQWTPFETVEQPFEQIWTRGLEVEVASHQWGQKMRDYYLNSKPGFVWPDGHPKNVFFSSSDPYVRAIDFDCSHFADQDYMLPNFFGQIPVFTVMGHINLQQGVDFIKNLILGYQQVEAITPEVEKKMVFYAATQTIQRQDGKWLFDVCGGDNDEALKRKAYLFYFGRRALNIETFDQYLDELENSLRNWPIDS